MDYDFKRSDKIVKQGNDPTRGDGSPPGRSGDSVDEVAPNEDIDDTVLQPIEHQGFPGDGQYAAIAISQDWDDVANFSTAAAEEFSIEIFDSPPSLCLADRGVQRHEPSTELHVDVSGPPPESPFRSSEREALPVETTQGTLEVEQDRGSFQTASLQMLPDLHDVDPEGLTWLLCSDIQEPNLRQDEATSLNEPSTQVGNLGQNGDGSRSITEPIEPRSTKQEGEDTTELPTALAPTAKKRNQTNRPTKYNKADALAFPRRLLARIDIQRSKGNKALAEVMGESKRKHASTADAKTSKGRRKRTDGTESGRYKCNLCQGVLVDTEHQCPFVSIPKKLLEDLMPDIPDFPKDYKTIIELLNDKDRIKLEIEQELDRIELEIELKRLENKEKGIAVEVKQSKVLEIKVERPKNDDRINRKEGLSEVVRNMLSESIKKIVGTVEVKKLKDSNKKIMETFPDADVEGGDDQKIGPAPVMSDGEVSEPGTVDLGEPDEAPPLFASMPKAADGGGAADGADTDSSEDEVRPTYERSSHEAHFVPYLISLLVSRCPLTTAETTQEAGQKTTQALASISSIRIFIPRSSHGTSNPGEAAPRA
jgi:hypothetical protein